MQGAHNLVIGVRVLNNKVIGLIHGVLMPGDTIEAYFNANELDSAQQYVEVFHGKILLNNELPRRETVLLGLYMICNANGSSQVSKADASAFISDLGVSKEDFSKGIYDLKDGGEVSEDSQERISLTFTGLKKIRNMLATSVSGTKWFAPTRRDEINKSQYPSVSAPKTLRQAILDLLSSDWGKKPRSLREITDALETNALFYPSSSIASNLMFMTKDHTLRRMKSGGNWSYVLKNPKT